MATAIKKLTLENYEGLAPDVWASAGIKPGDWIEVSTGEPGRVAIRLSDPPVETGNKATDEEDLTPYTLDEALALFRIDGPIDEAADAESWIAFALKDSLRGDDLA